MSDYFPKSYKSFREDIKIRVDISNYATKADIKNIGHVDTFAFCIKNEFS